MEKQIIEKLDFEKGNGLLPAIIQDFETSKVLMLGYMDREALDKTIADQRVTFFSRSKNRLWTKGETSGNFLELKSIQADCDNDSLLIKVKPKGVVCHTGSDTCFEEKNIKEKSFLDTLESVIQKRRINPSEKSYTSELFQKGINKIAQKVGEEAVELIIESKDQNDDLFLNEGADLIYHFLVLLQAKGFELRDIVEILKKRHE